MTYLVIKKIFKFEILVIDILSSLHDHFIGSYNKFQMLFSLFLNNDDRINEKKKKSKNMKKLILIVMVVVGAFINH
jgi:Pyruvate/2-oxoacid:ferredoxin oxidoreductase gamma subunit